VASTVNQYNNLFCNEYEINRADSASGTAGVLYGRYGGDIYGGGNPWVLTTAALAQLLYRAAIYVLNSPYSTGSVYPVSSDALNMWKLALNSPDPLPASNTSALADFFAAAGDGVLLRLRFHVNGYNWHLFEQLDKITGYSVWAFIERFELLCILLS
jgi:hypothetical protein